MAEDEDKDIPKSETSAQPRSRAAGGNGARSDIETRSAEGGRAAKKAARMASRLADAAAKERAGPEPTARRTCLLVLGMHRSGTSALTRVLSIAGAALPCDLMGRGAGNEVGHWESNRLVLYHDSVLHELGSTWHDWQALDFGRLPVKRRDEIRIEIGDILTSEYKEAPLIVVKDPRICRFAPFFLDTLKNISTDTRTVLVFRNPLEVYESLERRGSEVSPEIARADAGLMWLRHVLDAEHATRSHPRVFLSYGGFLSNWRAAFETLTRAFDIDWPYGIEDIAPQVDAFLKPEHRHHRRSTEDLLLDPVLRDWIGEAWQALLVLERNPACEAALAKLDSIRALFDGAAPILHRLRSEARAQWEVRATDLEAVISQEREKVVALEAGLSERSGEVSALQNSIAQEQDKITALEAALAERDARIDALQTSFSQAEEQSAALSATLAEREKQATDLEAVISQEREKVVALEAGLSERSGEVSALQNSIAQEQDKITTLEVDLAERNARIDALQTSFSQAEKQSAALSATLAEREKQATDLEAALNEAKNRSAEIIEALSRSEKEVSVLSAALMDAEKKRSRLEKTTGEKIDSIAWALKEKEKLLSIATQRAANLDQRLDEQGNKLRETEQRLAHAELVRDDLLRSTSWRITAPMRGVKHAFRAITRVNDASDLLAARSRQLVNAEHHGEEIHPTTTDPQYIIDLEKPLSPGWYEGKARIEVQKHGACHPKLYFDLGNGYKEETSARVIPTRRHNEYYARFFLPIGTSKVRFDPTDDLRPFVVHGLRLKRMSEIRTTMLLGRLAFAQLRSNSRRLSTRIAQYRTLSKQQRVLDIATRWQPVETDLGYPSWIARFDYDDDRDRAKLAAQVGELSHKPLISVVMPVYNTPAKLLDEAIQSVMDQVYPHWELCIANDASPKKHIRPQLDKWTARDKRIKVVHRTENGHISRASNSALELAEGEWIALLDHDDVLPPHALAEVAKAVNENPDAALIYSDEDKIDEKGNRFDPYFKCDYSPELFRSMNYLNHLTAHRTDLIREVGGWRPGFEGSQDYDINLRIIERIAPQSIVHISKVLYHWRATSGSTALASSEKSYPFEAGLRALEEHLARTNQDAKVLEIPRLPFYRIRHEIVTPPPLVSLIIPTRDRVDLLSVAIHSILEKTTYPHYEIIVMDNNSEQVETLTYLEEIAGCDNVRVIPHPQAFNFSAINNEGVRHARGDIIGLVNNDIEVITPEWLTEMVSWAQQDRIGCVGAKLLYPDQTIQHAGVVLGIGGIAGHAHKHSHRSDLGYFSRACLIQNYSAVTAACLLVRNSVYEQVGGLDAEGLPVAFNDVDFCLKVRSAGYDNVWTPFAELYHHESPSRGADDTPEKKARFQREHEVMLARWASAIAEDPYYSEHLTLSREDFSISL